MGWSVAILMAFSCSCTSSIVRSWDGSGQHLVARSCPESVPRATRLATDESDGCRPSKKPTKVWRDTPSVIWQLCAGKVRGWTSQCGGKGSAGQVRREWRYSSGCFSKKTLLDVHAHARHSDARDQGLCCLIPMVVTGNTRGQRV